MPAIETRNDSTLGQINQSQTQSQAMTTKSTLKVGDALLGSQGQEDLALMSLSGSNFLMGIKRELQQRKQNRERLVAERQQLLEGSVDISTFFGSPKPLKFIGPVGAEPALVKDLLKKPYIIAALNDGSIKLDGYADELASLGIGNSTNVAGEGDEFSSSPKSNRNIASSVKSPLPRVVAKWVNRHIRAAMIIALILIIFGLFQLILGLAIAISGGVEVIPLPTPATATTKNIGNNLTTQITATTTIVAGNTNILGFTNTPTILPEKLTQAATSLQETANALTGAKATQANTASSVQSMAVTAVSTINITPTPTYSMAAPTSQLVTATTTTPPATGVSNSGDPSLQHNGFMPPSQLVATVFRFASTSILPARAVGTEAPIAVPPKGTIYHFGAYGGEPGNCILVGDYETIGKPLLEQVEQNDLVSVVDRLGDVYTYRITNYGVVTDLMRNVLPQSATTTTTAIPNNGSTATASLPLQGYAGYSVLFQTNKSDLDLLAIPTNPKLAVVTLVSTARPGDNQNERLAVRGVLVAFKLAQSVSAGTPVAVGIAPTPTAVGGTNQPVVSTLPAQTVVSTTSTAK